jgi:putative transposase
MKVRLTDEQIIAMIKEQEAGEKTADVCRRHGISSATFYKYKSKYGGMEPSDAKRLRALEDENGKLKKLLAEQMFPSRACFAYPAGGGTTLCCETSIQKNGDARWEAASGGSSVQDAPREPTAGV